MFNIGASLTGFTITSTISAAVASACPSLTVNIRISVPFQSCVFPNVTISSLISTEILVFPETFKVRGSLSRSSTYASKSTIKPPSSA